MSAREMTLEVVVKLRDAMDAGLRSATGKLDRLHQKVKQISASVAGAIAGLDAKLGALGIGAGIGLMRGLDSTTRFDAGLRGIAKTASLTGDAVEKFAKDTRKEMETLSLATGQASERLLEAKAIMTANNIELDASAKMLGPIGKAATAGDAAVEDITKTAVATFQNAGLKPEELETALAHMVVAGKLGSFELKDMSQFYPEVLAVLGDLGIKGMSAIDTASAQLQISRRTAGTPGEAATNYRDFLSNINSAHTKKRFKDHGVDLTAVLADAQARGINPIEAVVAKVAKIIDQPKVVDQAIERARKKGLDPKKTEEEVRKAVEGAVQASGLGGLFVNQQAKLFLMGMLAFREEYKKIKAEVAGADAKVLDDDYASTMRGPAGKRAQATERVEQLVRRFGDGLTGIYEKVGWVAEKLQAMIDALDRISPKIIDTAVQLTALVGALSAAVLALKMMGFGGGAAAVAGGAGTAAAAATAGGTAGGGGGLLAGLGALVGRGASFASNSGLGIVAALGFASYALQQAFPTTKEGMAYRLDAGPIDFATYERAWREQKEWRRDPEAARGRAMMERGKPIALPEPIQRDQPHEPWFKVGKPDFSFENVTGSKAPDIQYGIGAAFAAMLKAMGAATKKPETPPPPQKVEVESKITVKVDGPGVVTSQSSSTSSDRGRTVGRP